MIVSVSIRPAGPRVATSSESVDSVPADGIERGAGACAIVASIVRSRDWCALYQETEDLAEFSHPDPLGEDGQQKPPVRR